MMIVRGEIKKSEELKMGIPGKYIDNTMHLAPIGNVVRFCCVYYFEILFRGFFFLFAAYRLLTQDDSVRKLAMRAKKEKNRLC
jgi:hypothetical protein